MDALMRKLSLLAEPVRVRLLAVLAEEELGVGELTRVLQLPQSTVSRHLKTLRTEGIVRRRAEGTRALFRAVDDLDDDWVMLWAPVYERFGQTLQFTEDRARLGATLEARQTDSSTFFGREHARWDQLREELFGERFWASALAALAPSDAVVLDLGCGTGATLERLAPWVRTAIGVDREPAMLRAAAQRLRGTGNVELRQGSLQALPLDDGVADVALCTLVLHHVDSPAEVFREVRRVLAPGGRFLLVDMAAHDRRDWRHTMGHRWLGFSVESLQRWAADAGLNPAGTLALAPDPAAAGPPLQLLRWTT